jgi:hypothetical protein
MKTPHGRFPFFRFISFRFSLPQLRHRFDTLVSNRHLSVSPHAGSGPSRVGRSRSDIVPVLDPIRPTHLTEQETFERLPRNHPVLAKVSTTIFTWVLSLAPILVRWNAFLSTQVLVAPTILGTLEDAYW